MSRQRWHSKSSHKTKDISLSEETKRINISYHIGDKATKDVIAYKDVVYYKDLLDESVKNRIIENTTPEYDRNKEVEDNSV